VCVNVQYNEHYCGVFQLGSGWLLKAMAKYSKAVSNGYGKPAGRLANVKAITVSANGQLYSMSFEALAASSVLAG